MLSATPIILYDKKKKKKNEVEIVCDTFFLLANILYNNNLCLEFCKHLQNLELRVKTRVFIPICSYQPVVKVNTNRFQMYLLCVKDAKKVKKNIYNSLLSVKGVTIMTKIRGSRGFSFIYQ